MFLAFISQKWNVWLSQKVFVVAQERWRLATYWGPEYPKVEVGHVLMVQFICLVNVLSWPPFRGHQYSSEVFSSEILFMWYLDLFPIEYKQSKTLPNLSPSIMIAHRWDCSLTQWGQPVNHSETLGFSLFDSSLIKKWMHRQDCQFSVYQWDV